MLCDKIRGHWQKRGVAPQQAAKVTHHEARHESGVLPVAKTQGMNRASNNTKSLPHKQGGLFL